MKAICVDDESLILNRTVDMCREIPSMTDVHGFSTSSAALQWVETHPVDLAILDIHMPGMNGITLARILKERQPDIAIIFLTGHSEYAVEAFALRASGYLMKPVSLQQLEAEVSYALKQTAPAPRVSSAIMARTFGQFELLLNGNPVSFKRARAKELLALLVDRRGSSMTRPEIYAVLWEDAPYDRAAQKQLDVIIRSLRETLSENHIDQILEMKSGNLRVVPNELDCDMYRLVAGDVEVIHAYRGEYMSSYSWASPTEAYLDRRLS